MNTNATQNTPQGQIINGIERTTESRDGRSYPRFFVVDSDGNRISRGYANLPAAERNREVR